MAFFLLGVQQDPVQRQIDEYLRQFQAAAQLQQSLVVLSAQLAALGDAAAAPIARRLADDLRDGEASAAVPALIDALMGRRDAWAPLQTAFRNPATTAAGRIELAQALSQLDDTMSWRDELSSLVADPQVSLANRLHAAGVLLAVEDPRAMDEVRMIAESVPDRPEADQLRIIEFLARANTPETRELLADAMVDPLLAPPVRLSAAESLQKLGDVARAGEIQRALAQIRAEGGEAARRADAIEARLRRWSEEPRTTLVDEVRRAGPAPAAAPRARKKKETADDSFFTMRNIVIGAVTIGLFVLLLALQRKG